MIFDHVTLIEEVGDNEKGVFFSLYHLNSDQKCIYGYWKGQDLGPERASRAFGALKRVLENYKPHTMIGDTTDLISDWTYLSQEMLDQQIPFYKSQGVARLVHVYPEDEKTKLPAFIIQSESMSLDGFTFKLFCNTEDAFNWALNR